MPPEPDRAAAQPGLPETGAGVGAPREPAPGPGAEAALERLDRLFATFDRLTPDELARIGVGAWDTAERDALLREVDEAAARTGREAMVLEARARARDVVLRRYNAGALHQTFVGLNWGLSQGTVEDRVGIVETLSDAAAAAIVEDVLDPEAYEAMALPAEHIVRMAAGTASEGALSRVMDVPADPDLGRSRRVRTAIAIVAGVMVFVTILPLAYVFELPLAPLMALLAAIAVVVVAVRR